MPLRGISDQHEGTDIVLPHELRRATRSQAPISALARA
jgi:hypothetical protein